MERKRTTSQENAKKKFLRDETVTVAPGHWPGAEAIASPITLMNNFAPATVIVNYIPLPWKRCKINDLLTSQVSLRQSRSGNNFPFRKLEPLFHASKNKIQVFKGLNRIQCVPIMTNQLR